MFYVWKPSEPGTFEVWQEKDFKASGRRVPTGDAVIYSGDSWPTACAVQRQADKCKTPAELRRLKTAYLPLPPKAAAASSASGPGLF